MAADNPAAQVRVTNRNNVWKVIDRYAGVEYKFPPGETVTVAREVAEHIFGYGLDDKGKWQKFLRSGLANQKDGKAIWERIVVKPLGGNVAATGAVRQAA